MDTIPSRKISVQHGISGYKASLQDRESTSRLRVVIDFEFVSKEACHNFYTDLNTKPDLYRYTFILHIIEGSLDEVKLRAKNALHALACQKKSELKNDHAERDFSWTDERTTGYTPTRSRPLRDIDPALGETTGGEQVWYIYQEMLALQARALSKIDVSGNYVSREDKYDQFCAFAQLGGGSVTDNKLLYMLIRWADVDFSRLGAIEN